MRGLVVLLMLPLAPALAEPAPAGDPQFLAAYQQQYRRVGALQPDMLVEELRLRIELVASRGSAVGAASNERRVRGFETNLLQRLQETLCGKEKTPPPTREGPAAPVVDSVNRAAAAQRLRTVGTDTAELSAITQRLVDSQGDALCSLQSLDDVQ